MHKLGRTLRASSSSLLAALRDNAARPDED
jgi:hypothetical protein